MITFTYNGINSRAFNIIAKSVNRPILPDLRIRELVIPGKHGVYDFGINRFDKRMIQVDFQYIGTSFNELRTRARNISSWLNAYDGFKNLVFSDEPDKYYVAKIYSSIGLANLFKIGQATIQFECQPFAYATACAYDQTFNYDTGELYDNGLIYPNCRTVYDFAFLAPYFNIQNGNSRLWMGFPWTYNPHMTSLENYATIVTPLTITIYGQVQNPRIYQETTSASFTISANMTSGSTMVINSEAMTVTLNGVNYLNQMTGSFLNLEVGANGFFFYGTNPIAEVTFSFNHQWL